MARIRTDSVPGITMFIMLVFLLVSAAVRADATPNHYVWTNSPSKAAPYTNWAMAAHAIQPAVDAAEANDTVWVTNGTYTLTNQISISNAITVRSVNGRNVTIVDGNYPANETRCFMVSNANALVRGFTITNGFSRSSSGGGVYLTFGATIRDCLISGNTALDANGGGVYISRTGTVDFCSVVGNVSTGSITGGGGVYFSSGGTVTNSIIAGNLVFATNNPGYYVGGGGAFLNSGGLIQNCVISSNNAQIDVGYGGGGGAFVLSGRIINSIISGNTNNSRAGGVVNQTGGTLRNCLIINNKGSSSLQAGGVYCNSWTGTIQNCTIANNQSCTFWHGCGLGINGHQDDKPALIVNCVIVSNYTYAGVLRNCVFSGELTNSYMVHTCTYPTNFTAGVTNIGCIPDDPVFVDYPAGDYRLTKKSPCINAGTNQDWMIGAVDMDGHSRIDRHYGHRVDMGAYEYIPKGTIFSIGY